MAERTYLPLILFTAILSALCTLARNAIDYQLIALCRQCQKASALRLHTSARYLHPFARVCTATIPHTPHDKTGVPPAHYGIGGADFLSEQQIFLPPYTFFSDWHKRFDAPGTSTSAEGSADKFSPPYTLLFTLIIKALQGISAECRQFYKKTLYKDCLHHLH